MNFGEVKAAIGTWLDKGDIPLPASVRGQIVNMVVQEYCRRFDLNYNEFSAAVSATINVPSTVLPTGFSRPYQMYFYTANIRTNVEYLDREEFLAKYPNNVSTGPVKNYTIWGQNIWWGPVPSATTAMTFDIYRLVPDLSADSDSNDFTLYAWPLLLFRSCCLASMFGVEDARMAVWQSEYARLENQLVVEQARAKSSGRRPIGREMGYAPGGIGA